MSSEWVFVSKKDSIGNDIKYKAGPPDFAGADDRCQAINTLGFYKDKVILPLRECAYYTADSDGIYIRRRAIEDLLSGAEEEGIELQKYAIE